MSLEIPMVDSFRIQFQILKKQASTKWAFGILVFLSVVLGLIIYHFSSFSGSLNFLSLMKGDKNGVN